jgi:hypothetical protein
MARPKSACVLFVLQHCNRSARTPQRPIVRLMQQRSTVLRRTSEDHLPLWFEFLDSFGAVFKSSYNFLPSGEPVAQVWLF